MPLHFQLAPQSRWASLKQRLEGACPRASVTLCDGEGVSGHRLLLHRLPVEGATDEVGFFVEPVEPAVVEIGPAGAADRALVSAAWEVARAANLVPVRIAPGASPLVDRVRAIERRRLGPEEEAARLAVFIGETLAAGITSAHELRILFARVRPAHAHPFDVLNALQGPRRDSLLEAARTGAGLAHLPAPLRRDLRSATRLDERRVALRRDGGVARIRMIHPQSLNALDPELLDELGEAWATAEAHAEAIVLESRGPAFMAGVDLGRILAWMEEDRLDRIRDFVTAAHRFLDRVDRCPHHTVARVEGLAIGAGAEFCAAFDTVVASEGAGFGFPELTLGIYPAMGGTQRLPRRIGLARAREWVLSAAIRSARVAAQDGLVDAVVQTAELGAEVQRLVVTGPPRARAARVRFAPPGPVARDVDPDRWRRRCPEALCAFEELSRLSLDTTLEAGLAAELEALARVYGTPDVLDRIRRAHRGSTIRARRELC